MTANTQTFDGTNAYRVVAMRPAGRSAAAHLVRAFMSGLTAIEDPKRKDFYSVEIDGVSYYFHVFGKRHVAYFLWSELPERSPAEGPGETAIAECPCCREAASGYGRQKISPEHVLRA